MSDYTFIDDLETAVPDIPEDSIISRTFYKDDHVHAILFGFAPGQELSEHTSTYPAVLHFLRGDARLTLGDEEKSVAAGAWVHMPPRLPHSIVAETPLTMLLLILRGGEGEGS
jgi:quercetin dioxygenase-like cupin family protein